MLALTWVDWILVAVVLLSGGFGAMSGFIKEILGVVVWVVAGMVSWRYAGALAIELAPWLELPSTRIMAATAILFVLILVVGALLTRVVDTLVKAVGLKPLDRVAGLLFGGVRGLCILVVAVGLLRQAPVQNDPWWRQSVLLPDLVQASEWAKGRVPELYRQHSSRLSDLTGR